jgi:uncharacterized cupredoxin-like copper-binding protein
MHLARTRTILLAFGGIATMACAATAFAHGDGTDNMPHRTPAEYSKAPEMPFGRATDPAKATRTITINMSDAMRYDPSEITVQRGERIRFVVRNGGKTMHEMILGSLDELKEHGELMKKFPDMEHDELHMAHVPPGKSLEMGWQFSRAGEFFYGCLAPGHFEAGMLGRIVVK